MAKKFSSTPSYIWDAVSEEYEDLSFHGKADAYPANSFRYELLFEFLDKQPKGKILDAGCGPGLMSRLLQKRGWEVSACDYSEGMVKTARKKAKEENLPDVYQLLSVFDLAKIDKKFDYVILNGVLPYISSDEEPKVFAEIKEVLKPNGYLISSHYNLYFDVFGFDKWTVETLVNNILAPAGLPKDEVKVAEEKISSLLNNPEKTPDQERTMKLENPLSYKDKLASFGFEQFDQAYYNLFYLPSKFEAAQNRQAREKLERKLSRDSLGLLLYRTFVSFAKSRN